MAMNQTATRYEIELDVIERRPDLADRDAIELLRSEFRLALNASHFIALSADDPEIAVHSRTAPQEGIARYVLTMEFAPRRVLPEQDAIELVRSEFQRALNASYFQRIFVEDPTITVDARELVGDDASLRWAA
jgi:hypothetical protein